MHEKWSFHLARCNTRLSKKTFCHKNPHIERAQLLADNIAGKLQKGKQNHLLNVARAGKPWERVQLHQGGQECLGKDH